MRSLKFKILAFCLVCLGVMTPQAWAVKLKIATISPEGSMWMEQMRKGAKQVAKETDNRVKFKFYPGGVMGNDKAVLRKIRVGQLHGGAVVGGSLANFFPANQLYAQPLKFSGMDEVDYVRQKMDAFIMKGLYDAGFVTFGLSSGGFAYVMSSRQVRSVSDLRSCKVWMPDNDKMSQEMAKVFGLSPIPLPLADVRTGLQSGLIDTVATSPMAALILQWHTQVKYVTDLPIMYVYGVLAISKKRFLKIPEKDRVIVTRIMTDAFKEIDRLNREDDIKATAALKNQGIQFIKPETAHMSEWQQMAGKYSDNLVTSGVIPKETAEEVNRLIKEFRSGTAAAKN